MKYYHCCETDRVLSEDDLRSIWEQGKAEGWIVPGETGSDSFPDYLECCMYYNNGTLTPVRTYIESLRRERRCYDHTDEYDAEELNALNEHIEELTKLESEA